jgi:cytochrome P450
MSKNSLIAVLAAHQQDRRAYYESIFALHGGTYLFWDEFLSGWVLTGYEECRQLLLSHRVHKLPPVLPQVGDPTTSGSIPHAESILRQQFIHHSDGRIGEEERTYWARVVRMDANGDAVGECAHAVLHECSGKAGCDLYSDLLRPYVSRCVCRHLGIEEHERAEILPLIMDYVQFLDGKVISPEDLASKATSIVTLHRHLLARVSSKRIASPPSGVTDDEWISNYMMVVTAGHESTAFLLGTVFEQSFRFGGLLELLRIHADHLTLVEEALRFDSPVQIVARCAATDFRLADRDIKRGQRLFLHIGSANRDPRIFLGPEDFNPGRSGPKSLAFGIGAGHCLGMQLARRSAAAMLSAIVRQCSEVHIRHDRISLSCGLSGREFYRIPGRLVLATEPTISPVKYP